MKLGNIKVGSRLWLGFGLITLLLIVQALVGLRSVTSLNEDTRTIVDDTVPTIVRVAEVTDDLNRVGISLRNMLLVGDAATIKNEQAAIAKVRVQVSETLTQLEKLLVSDQDRAHFKAVQDARTKYLAGQDKLIGLIEAGKKPEAIELLLTGVRDDQAGYMGALSKMSDREKAGLAELRDEAGREFTAARSAAFGSIGFGIVLAGLIAWRISRSITRPLGGALALADAMAEGDLSRTIDTSGNDETARLLQSMQRMVETFKDFVAAQQQMAGRHDAGDIDAQIDAAKFPGVYGQMAASINDLSGAQVALSRRIVEVVGRYAQGDVSIDMERLPGKKAQFTAAVAGVKQSLTAINAEIATMVEAAVRGDLAVRGDVSKYRHDFRRMVEGLNTLVQTCDEAFAELSRVLGALARGDLTERITKDYAGTFGQLKDDANETVAKLSEIIASIKESTESIDTAAKEIAAGNADLSQRTEEQASSLEETASSMEELTSTVKQNAENARQANQLASGASEIATKGGAVVGQVVATMNGISESSKKIAEIISVIDGIAFQTNILALNAAVEAARAGEQGRGFAVVATEVRNLAQRSAAAAKEIKDLITTSVRKVDDGSKLVDQAGRTMEEIVASVRRVTDIMGEITAASQEQSSGIEQVSQAVGQMDQVTQQNAALVEQAAAAAESLEEQAQNLARAVSVFRLAPAGRSAPRAAPDRRMPDRPKNVARIAPPKPADRAAPAPKPIAKSASADDWKEF